jgi:hypothetical protein
MKNLLKILIILNLLINSDSFGQCDPITIPGGTFCLEGTAGNPDICLLNYNGSFVISKKPAGQTAVSRLIYNDSNLSLFGKNDVGSTFDLSFDFLSAGSAFIRSKRGGNMDTELQFMTNPSYGTANTPASPPPVRMVINSEGNIGINTPAAGPNYRLDVYGVAKFCDESIDDGKVVIKGANTPNYVPDGNIFSPSNFANKRDLSFEFVGAGSSKIRSFRGGQTDTYLQFLTSAKGSSVNDSPIVRMQINEDGKIIMGNVTVPTAASTPYKLYVEGGILTEKVKVALKSSAQWSDHVFAPEYNLKSLYEVEQYINQNKHLPNIPSADELVKEGVDVVEMQSKQMEKIEELTLYMIEMKKDIDSLRKENSSLKEEISNLKKKS